MIAHDDLRGFCCFTRDVCLLLVRSSALPLELRNRLAPFFTGDIEVGAPYMLHCCVLLPSAVVACRL